MNKAKKVIRPPPEEHSLYNQRYVILYLTQVIYQYLEGNYIVVSSLKVLNHATIMSSDYADRVQGHKTLIKEYLR